MTVFAALGEDVLGVGPDLAGDGPAHRAALHLPHAGEAARGGVAAVLHHQRRQRTLHHKTLSSAAQFHWFNHLRQLPLAKKEE